MKSIVHSATSTKIEEHKMKTLTYGSNDTEVLALGRLLRTVGYNDDQTAKPTYPMTAGMAYFLGRFQFDNDLKVDFKYGPKTKAVLERRVVELVSPKLDVDPSDPFIALPEPMQESLLIGGRLNPVFAVGEQLTTAERVAVLGDAGDPRFMTRINTPYPLRLAWDTNTEVNTIYCHKAVAGALLAAMSDVLDYYGITAIKRLDLNMFGGCFNKRPIRGGTELSTHSWGISIDWLPGSNPYRAKPSKCAFATEPYRAFVNIMKHHGFRTMEHDLMHWQYCGKRS